MFKNLLRTALFSVYCLLNLSMQAQTRDTVFIYKDPERGAAQSIFFENDSNSVFYESINYWDFLMFDQNSYTESLSRLAENKQALTHKKPLIPFTRWITLKQYQGRFYAYHPCDFYTHFRQSVNDSTFIDWTGEGPVANRILLEQKMAPNLYEYRLSGPGNPDRQLRIHIIDPAKGIALFEETGQEDHTDYYLMIAAEKIRSVPLIVNNCEWQKQRELHFEEPDVQALLKKK